MTSPACARVPAGVAALGVVSFLMDASSELIHGLLPLLLVGTMGVGPALYGLVEGIAEALAMAAKPVSGAWSDRLGRRKPLVVGGYGLAAAVKPLFALAPAAAPVFAARLADRLAKGIRGAPRDALIADLTPTAVRGAAYGLRQTLDSAGAVLGPLLAFALMRANGGDLRAALWWAVPPAVLAVAVLLLSVPEPRRARAHPGPTPARRLDLGAARALGPAYWRVAALAALFTTARFSEGFLLLRASGLGVADSEVPLALAGLSVVYAASAYPCGRLSDRLGRGALLGLGAAVLAAADVVLALAGGPIALALGVALWGLHLGLTQGVLSALVADVTGPGLRGTGFGFFGLVTGAALLAASALAGALWALAGPPATFWAAAALAGAAAAGVRWLGPAAAGARGRA